MSDTQTTALVPVEQRAALALNAAQTEQQLNALAIKHKSITEIKDKNGREQAHGAAMELKNARIAIKDAAEAAREDATKFSKAVIKEEKRLIGIIEAEEKRLFAVRDAWDEEQERIRAEAAAKEQARVQRIRAAITSIEVLPMNLLAANATALEQAIRDLTTLVIDEAYEEFQPHAESAKADALSKMTEMLELAKQREEAARKLDEERAEAQRKAEAEEAAAKKVREELEARLRAAEEDAQKAKAAQAAAEEALAATKKQPEVPVLTETVELPITMVEPPINLSALELTNQEWHITEQIRAVEVVEAVARALDLDAEEAEQRVLRAAIYLTNNHEEEVAA